MSKANNPSGRAIYTKGSHRVGAFCIFDVLNHIRISDIKKVGSTIAEGVLNERRE